MKVTFNINFHTVWGQKLCIVGSIPELGSWEPALAKEMNYKGDGNWQLELELELTSPQQTIEYRYFLSINDKQIFEEWEKNHQVTFEGGGDVAQTAAAGGEMAECCHHRKPGMPGKLASG